MRKPKGYDEAQTYSDNYRLPAGGYVVKSMKARLGRYENSGNECLELTFDISEGQYNGFYRKQYEESQFEPKKYKGTIRINLPKEDGSEQDGWTIRTLKTQMTAIEDSNEGYTWEWDENTLVGLTAGLLFRNKEYEYNGKQGFWTEPFRFIAAEKVRSGDFTIPKDKLLNHRAQSYGAESTDFTPVSDDEVPF